MSLWAIIPVKPLKNAKSRLTPVLRPEQRFELAQAMFRHVLSVATTIQQVTGVLVSIARYQSPGYRARNGRQDFARGRHVEL